MTSDPFDDRCWRSRCNRPVTDERDFLCADCFQQPAGVPWWRRLAAALADRKGRVTAMLRSRTRGRVQPHLLKRDPEIPPDLLGRVRCTECRLMGKPDDVRHTVVPQPARPLSDDLAAAARERDAAVLGEHYD